MEHIDPAKAARVWQRVQASLKQSPAPAAPTPQRSPVYPPKLPPIPVCTTPPEAWQPAPSPRLPQRKQSCPCRSSSMQPWIWLLALILLLPHKNS